MQFRNEAFFIGILEEPFTYSHTTFSKKVIMKSRIVVRSGEKRCNHINIKIEQTELRKQGLFSTGDSVYVSGEFTTYQYYGENFKKHHQNYIFINQIKHINSEIKHFNYIHIRGRLERIDIQKKPFSGGVVQNVIVSTKCEHNRTNACVPAIMWNQVAKKFALSFKEKDEIEIIGGFQSRVYKKTRDDEGYDELETYEVSVWKFDF